MKITLLVISFLFVSVALVHAGEARNSSVRLKFLHSLGLKNTPHGCQADHIVSLHLGGQDEVENLCLICGDKLPVKEWAERRPETLRLWLHDNRAWLKKKGCRYQWESTNLR